MTYPMIQNLPLRTDTAFRNKTQEGHHRGVSPFLQLHNLDIIRDFPLDYLHQVCLSAPEKLLLTWNRGPRAMCRISATKNEQVSANLINIRKDIPRKFARRPRGLDEVEQWKITEFRQFLLYTGTFVVKGILRQHNYDYVMALSVAMCILVNSKLTTQYGNYAHQLLQHFVSKCAELYGREFLVYNVHTPAHIAREAQHYGDLDSGASEI